MIFRYIVSLELFCTSVTKEICKCVRSTPEAWSSSDVCVGIIQHTFIKRKEHIAHKTCSHHLNKATTKLQLDVSWNKSWFFLPCRAQIPGNTKCLDLPSHLSRDSWSRCLKCAGQCLSISMVSEEADIHIQVHTYLVSWIEVESHPLKEPSGSP